jgi:hypothetical protein
LVFFRVACLSCPESGLDGINTLILEASNLDICTDFRGLRSQSLSDVGLKFLRDRVAGKGDVVPYIRIP